MSVMSKHVVLPQMHSRQQFSTAHAVMARWKSSRTPHDCIHVPLPCGTDTHMCTPKHRHPPNVSEAS